MAPVNPKSKFLSLCLLLLVVFSAFLLVSCKDKENLNNSAVMESQAYSKLKEPLQSAKNDSGALDAYVVIKDKKGVWYITIDASDSPAEFLSVQPAEIPFEEAINGHPSTCRYAWEAEHPRWFAAAPVKNGKSEIVAVLVVSYATPKVKEYPEWIRDSDSWNGIESEITENIPPEVGEAMTHSLGYASDIAGSLNGKWGDSFQKFMKDFI